MIAWKYKTWRTAGVAAVALTALAACGGEGGAGGEAGGAGEGGEGGDATVAAPPTPAPVAGAAPAGGGEAGEAGAASAYAGLTGDQRTALRIAHLRGFIMAASTVAQANQPDEAGVLVQQGVLEVFDSAPSEFGSLNMEIIRAAADTATLSKAQRITRLRAAEAELTRASADLDAEAAITTARMIDIATGLYQLVVQEDFVDPIEYQHSMGAAMSARAVLINGEGELRRENLRAYGEAVGALNRFVGLWPEATAPEQPTPYREVLTQGSRVRLALSPYL